MRRFTGRAQGRLRQPGDPKRVRSILPRASAGKGDSLRHPRKTADGADQQESVAPGKGRTQTPRSERHLGRSSRPGDESRPPAPLPVPGLGLPFPRRGPGSRGQPKPDARAAWKGPGAARATESKAYAEFGSRSGENPHLVVVVDRPGRRQSPRAFRSRSGAPAAERALQGAGRRGSAGGRARSARGRGRADGGARSARGRARVQAGGRGVRADGSAEVPAARECASLRASAARSLRLGVGFCKGGIRTGNGT